MINALRYTEDLEEAGFTSEQAKRSVKIWMDLMNDNFASKHDLEKIGFVMKSDLEKQGLKIKSEIERLGLETSSEFAAVRSEMKEEFASVRSEMKGLGDQLTIKLGVLMATGIGLVSLMGRL